ncbi:hypothetical protein [Erythrobacter sp. HI0063]|uniref:hypothetical protein n=1 Tax=Erythrobacter sp. HI0063 TaxID=1822240 RepID=UPI000A8E1102|nr:hypothetical protein [Erythrobacter sp. HI0063]
MNPFEANIDWQALAILLSGLAAVSGAVWIADRQNRLRHDEVRIALFDRRRETLRLFDTLSGEWWRGARLPEEKEAALRELVRDIELLYGEVVQQQAKRLFEDTVFQNMFAQHARLYGDEKDDKWLEAIERGQDRLEAIANRLPALRELLVNATQVGRTFDVADIQADKFNWKRWRGRRSATKKTKQKAESEAK